jgi:hypothetical protein
MTHLEGTKGVAGSANFVAIDQYGLAMPVGPEEEP